MAAACIIKEAPLGAHDERTLLGDGHSATGSRLWYRTACVGGAEAGFVVVDGRKIVKLGVLPEFRRRGVASALLLEACDRIRRDPAAFDAAELFARRPRPVIVFSSSTLAAVGATGQRPGDLPLPQARLRARGGPAGLLRRGPARGAHGEGARSRDTAIIDEATISKGTYKGA